VISNPYIVLPLIAILSAFVIEACTTNRTDLRLPPRRVILRRSAALLVMCGVLAMTILSLLLAGSGRSVLFPTSIYFVITGLYYQSLILSLGIPVLVFVAVCLPSMFSEGKGVPTRLRILLLLALVGSLLHFALFWTMGVEQRSFSFTFGVAAVNAALLGSIVVTAWLLDRLRTPTYAASICLAFLLIVWLCVLGFPHLGKLP
jgi:hypothetical protein